MNEKFNETSRQKDAERATKIATKLLSGRRLSSWESGFLQRLRPHCPTPRQWEILERLAVKYNMDFPIESNEDETQKRNGASFRQEECAAALH
jgi:hypothetical protein